MEKPLLIIVGADKGGVGKTMFSRVLMEYDPFRGIEPKLYDTESKLHNLKRYFPIAQMLDIEKIDDQMLLFDNMPPVTLVDIKSGLLSVILRSMRELELIGPHVQHPFNLIIFHVIGGSISSLEEIVDTSAQLESHAEHILVKNFISDSQFFDFDVLTKSKYFNILDIKHVIEMKHLAGRAQEAVDLYGKPFRDYLADKNNSVILRGYVAKWLQETHAEFERINLSSKLK